MKSNYFLYFKKTLFGASKNNKQSFVFVFCFKNKTDNYIKVLFSVLFICIYLTCKCSCFIL